MAVHGSNVVPAGRANPAAAAPAGQLSFLRAIMAAGAWAARSR